jgi:hypothetical protein
LPLDDPHAITLRVIGLRLEREHAELAGVQPHDHLPFRVTTRASWPTFVADPTPLAAAAQRMEATSPGA